MRRGSRFGPFALRAACVLVLGGGVASAPAHADRGTGPGGYGWVDCREPDGPPCDWVSVATSDGLTGLCSDEVYGNRPMGFVFPFYDFGYDRFAVSANGVIYFSGAPGSGGDVTNLPLGGTEGSAFIAVLWDDWAMDNDDELGLLCPDPGCSNTGPITMVESYQTGNGTDGGVRFRDVEWFSTAHHRPVCTEDFGQQATFAVRMYEDGRILLQYQDTDLGLPAVDHGASATIGVTAGFDGNHTQVSFDDPFIPSNPFTILFTPSCPELDCVAARVDDAEVCFGETQTFTADMTGGVAPVTVEWDFDSDGTPDDSGNPTTTVLPVGTWTVTALVSDSCADPGAQTCSETVEVTVHPLPVVTVTPDGPTTFCAALGESVVLQTEAAASYQWLRDGTPISGATNQTYEATTSGQYAVRVVDANGCSAESEPLMVVADDCPVECPELTCLSITVTPDPACEGEQQTFTLSHAGGEGAVTVSWDVDGDGVPDLSGNPLRIVLPAGMHDVTGFAEDSCADPGPQGCDLTVTTEVRAPPMPVVTPLGSTSFCAAEGEIVVL